MKSPQAYLSEETGLARHDEQDDELTTFFDVSGWSGREDGPEEDLLFRNVEVRKMKIAKRSKL